MPDRPDVIDLQWLGRSRCIAAWRVGDVLVDCGPATTLETLLAALGEWRPTALLLTHIHFDHAGATGALVQRWPDLEVVVHQRGARHMIAPERLEASARRVFGAEFDRRFGPMVPVPEDNVVALEGTGERVHGFRALDTPGHASHHLAYVDDDGKMFPGDVAGVRLVEGGPLLPPTPPPDIDVALWLASLRRVRAEQPAWLGLPHFGAVSDPGPYLEEAVAQVRRLPELAALPEDEYIATVSGELGAGAKDYTTVVPLPGNHAGLRRWADAQEG